MMLPIMEGVLTQPLEDKEVFSLISLKERGRERERDRVEMIEKEEKMGEKVCIQLFLVTFDKDVYVVVFRFLIKRKTKK